MASLATARKHITTLYWVEKTAQVTFLTRSISISQCAVCCFYMLFYVDKTNFACWKSADIKSDLRPLSQANHKKWRLWSQKLRSIKLMDRQTDWHFVWSASTVAFNHSNIIFWNEWGIPDHDMKQTNQSTTLPTIDLPRHRFGEYNFVNLDLTPEGRTSDGHRTDILTHRTMYWVTPQLKIEID